MIVGCMPYSELRNVIPRCGLSPHPQTCLLGCTSFHAFSYPVALVASMFPEALGASQIYLGRLTRRKFVLL